MANISAKGVIIKQSDYGEGHRMLSIFTEEYGIIKAVSYGVKKSKSKSAAASQFLNYAEFDLYKAANRDILTVNSIDTLDGFYPVCEDIKKLALCNYLADITYEIMGTANPDERILHLFLNSVYALAYRNEDIYKIKTVYELKLMTAGGYAPNINCCANCGDSAIYAFDTQKGGTVCKKCMSQYSVKLNDSAYKALGYIISCEDRRMLAFTAEDALIKLLNKISERYVSFQLDSKFPSLDYFKMMTEI